MKTSLLSLSTLLVAGGLSVTPLGFAAAAPTAEPLQTLEGEVADVKAFLAGSPALAFLAETAMIVKNGTSFTIDLPGDAGTLFIARSSDGHWFAVLPVGNDKLSAILPSEVLGGQLESAVFVVGSGGAIEASRFSAGSLPYQRLTESPISGTITGLQFRADIKPGAEGAFGKLANAGWLPSGASTLSGSFGVGIAGKLLGSGAGLDFSVSLALDVPGFTPAPFSSSSVPRLVFAETRFKLTGSGSGLLIEGTQKGTKLVLPSTTATFDTSLSFVRSGSSYTIKAAGWTTLSSPITDFLSVKGMNVKTIGIDGEIASTPGTQSFGGDVHLKGDLNGADFDAEMGALVENGALVDVGFQLNNNVTFVFTETDKLTLTRPRVGISPASQQGYLTASAAKLVAKGYTFLLRDPALVVGLSGAAVMGKVDKLNLDQLTKSPSGTFPKFGNSSLVFATSKFALPARVAELAAEAKLSLPNGAGLRLRTEFDLSTFTTTKQLLQPSPGSVLELAGEVSTGEFSLEAGLPGGDIVVPGTNDTLKLLSPKMKTSFIGGTAAVGVVGQMNVAIRPSEIVKVQGALSVNTAGVVSATGTLLNDWTNPGGLVGVYLGPNASVTLSADPLGVNVGFQAGGRIKTTTYQDVGLCLGISAVGLKGIGLSFKASEVSSASAMEPFAVVIDTLAANEALLAAVDPANLWRADLRKIAKSESYATDYLNSKPAPFVKKAVFYVLTPGASCPDLPIFSGGASGSIRTELAGQLLLRLPNATEIPLAEMEAKLGLEETLLKGKTEQNYKLAKVLELQKFNLDTLVLSPANPAYSPLDPGHFFLKTKGKIFTTVLDLDVALSDTGASFEFGGEVLGVGGLRFVATTVGSSLASANDITLGLAVSEQASTQDAVLGKLSSSFTSAADTLYGVEKDVESTQDKLNDKIDDLNGDLNGLKNRLGDALAALSGWGESSCRKARSNKDVVGIEICKAVYPILDAIEATSDKLAAAKIDLSVFKTSADYLYAANKTANQKARGFLTMASGIGRIDSSVLAVSKVTFSASLASRSGTMKVDLLVSGKPLSRTAQIDLDNPSEGSAKFFADLALDATKLFEIEARKSGTPANVAVTAATPTTWDHLGAALKWDGGRAYLFDGSRYERYSTTSGWDLDSGYPKTVSVWKACSTCYGMDAALKFGGYAYFFRGGEVIKWNEATDIGAPAQPIASYFPNLPADFLRGVEAAEYWGTDRAYFFKGDKVVLLDTKLGTILPGYPKTIAAEFAVDASFVSGIDTAMWGEGGKAYFFKGDKYLRVDVATRKMDAGYPKPISGAW